MIPLIGEVVLQSPALAATVSSLSGLDILLRVLSVLVLIIINAFFVTAEFSIVSVRRSRIDQLVAEGDAQAKTVQKLQGTIERLLSTTQLGITLSSVALGWIGENTVAVLVESLLQSWSFSERVRPTLAHSAAIPIAFLLLAYLQIVLGELCPKSVALIYPERLARLLAPPSLAIGRLFNPFIWALNQSTRWLLRLGGIQYTGQGWYNQVTPEELQLIIATSTESSGLEAEERELLSNVFEFGEVVAEEVMVPRTSIESVPVTATFQTLLNEVAASGHDCYPVIGESLDDIRGLIYFSELAKPLAEGTLTPETPIQPWIESAKFVPERILLGELLPLMQRSHTRMMVVVDEFGGTAGIITLEDLVAEIIGRTYEPTSNEPPAIQILNEHSFVVQAQTDLEEVNEVLHLDLPLTDEYQTLAGFVLYQLQKIPDEGEVFYYANLEFTIVSTEGPRLNQIQIRQLDTASPEKGFIGAPTNKNVPANTPVPEQIEISLEESQTTSSSLAESQAHQRSIDQSGRPLEPPKPPQNSD